VEFASFFSLNETQHGFFLNETRRGICFAHCTSASTTEQCCIGQACRRRHVLNTPFSVPNFVLSPLTFLKNYGLTICFIQNIYLNIQKYTLCLNFL
jgi:hypothetical protein